MHHKKMQTEFNESEIWDCLVQMTRGLKALHDRNILHRDLKSANVFMQADGVTKLGDLNVSKIAQNDGLLFT
jgi:NIMA (never in mitosis gene a)-related kinase